MKKFHLGFILRPRLIALAVFVAGLTQTSALAASSGELDPAFDPVDQGFALEYYRFPVMVSVGHDVFVNDFLKGFLRFDENGHRYSSWQLAAPFTRPVTAAIPLPSGGWMISDLRYTYFQWGDGTYRKMYVSSPQNPVFPKEDGSALIGQGYRAPIKIAPNGSADPTYSLSNRLDSVSFNDGAGMWGFGGPNTIPFADAREQIILGGNFTHCGAYERLGLVRLLADGSPDAAWNPAPALGMGQPGVAFLNAIPDGFFPGPSNSVIASLLFRSTNGLRNIHIATIDSTGSVLGSFPAPAFGRTSFICVQPDGRLLVSGSFTNWSGQPMTGLVRLNVDGSVDPSFSVQLTRSNKVASVDGMALDGFGRLVIAGAFDSVNGVPRPGFARVFAYNPGPQTPSAAITEGQPRIATNEVLYLTASVDGFPAPDLQWYHDGVAIPGATSRGLRVPIQGSEDVGHFQLRATSTAGSTNIDFPTVYLAIHSPAPGATNSFIYWPATSLPKINHLVPLSDGRVLAGAGVRNYYVTNSMEVDVFTNSALMVACFLKDGTLDPGFGSNGTVIGKGYVESLRVLPNGHILVAGGFTELAGSPASGLAEIDASGALVPRSFPALEPVLASSILPVPSGGYLVAGSFTNVGGTGALNVVKLTSSLEVDPSFHSMLEAGPFVEAMELDQQGRVLIAGARLYSSSSVILTNPVPVGLQRLLPNGSPDPAFTAIPGIYRAIFVEPEGTILVAPTFKRLSTDGTVVSDFQQDLHSLSLLHGGGPDHNYLHLQDGGGLYPVKASSPADTQLVRWNNTGTLDYTYQAILPSGSVEASAQLPDGSILLATWNSSPFINGPRRGFLVIPPDSDTRLSAPRQVNGSMAVDLATQPGRHYEIRRLTDIASGSSTLVAEIAGDGYIQHISTPADSGTLFVTLRRK
jgi:uncharacterized delta-60 repeat protein